MNMHTVVVTFGRNICGEPMPLDRWLEMRSQIVGACGAVGQVVQRPHAAGSQRGVWEGATEDACAVVVLLPGSSVPVLRDSLQRTAAEYQQEAIGFIVVEGTDHLVRP